MKCPECKGSGKVIVMFVEGFGAQVRCEECGGTGTIDLTPESIRTQTIRDLIAELEGDRKLVYPDAEMNHEINEIVIWWLEEKL